MDKFMPKTIEQLNAEFEARMEKAKQDELNAAAEKPPKKHEKPRRPAQQPKQRQPLKQEQQPKQKRLRKRDALKSAAMTA